MYRITKEFEFCYGHRLHRHGGKCRHLHGHNARAVIVLEARDLDEQGMVRDFGEVAEVVQSYIDAELDHTMLLHRDDPFLPAIEAAGERVRVLDLDPTAENLARLIYERARAAGLPVVEVAIWESASACAAYRPDGPARDAPTADSLSR